MRTKNSHRSSAAIDVYIKCFTRTAQFAKQREIFFARFRDEIYNIIPSLMIPFACLSLFMLYFAIFHPFHIFDTKKNFC